jgi:hypothetical protein
VIQNRAERAAGYEPDREAAVVVDTDDEDEEERPHNLVSFQGEAVPHRIAAAKRADLSPASEPDVTRADGWDIFKGRMNGAPVVYLVQHRVLGTNTEFEICRDGRAVLMSVDISSISADKLGPELSAVATNGIPAKRRKYLYTLPGNMRVKNAIELVNFGPPRISQHDGGRPEVEPKLFAIRLLVEEENPKPAKLVVEF